MPLINKERKNIMKTRSGKKSLAAVFLAAVLACVSVFPVFAAGEMSDVPALLEDSVTWEGGLLEIPFSPGSNGLENLSAVLYTQEDKIDNRYVLDLSLQETADSETGIASTSLLSNFSACNLEQPYTHVGSYPMEIAFFRDGQELCRYDFNMVVNEESQMWSVDRKSVPFDGSEDLTMNFTNGTNYYELKEITGFCLYAYFTGGMGPGEDVTEGITYDMDAGTVTIDKDVLKQAVIDFIGSKDELLRTQVYLNVFATTADGSRVQFNRIAQGPTTNSTETAWSIDVAELDFGSAPAAGPQFEFAGINAPGITVSTDSSEMLAAGALAFVQENYSDQLADLGDDYVVSAELVVNSLDSADVPEDVRAALSALVKDGTIAQYYDISVQADVLKDGAVVEDLENIPVTSLENDASVSIQIPENLAADGRTYTMLHYHDGQAAALNTSEADGVVTFETNGFSTYALAYADAQSTGSVQTPSVSGQTNVSSAASPKTGDEDGTAMMLMAVTVCVLMAAAAYGVRRKTA